MEKTHGAEQGSEMLAFVSESEAPQTRETVLLRFPDGKQTLSALLSSHALLSTKRGKLLTPTQAGLILGRVQALRRGGAFLIPESGGEDLFIPRDCIHTAMHGDVAYVRRLRQDRCEVAFVVSRGKTTLVGAVRGQMFVPSDARIAPMSIERGGVKSADGERVFAVIVQYPTQDAPARVRITEVLGGASDPRIDTLCTVRALGVRDVFPRDALIEAEALPESVSASAKRERRDLTHETIFTIDGRGSKDFDDAVGVSRLKNGNFLLGVHIADVSAYVSQGGAPDREARLRGTSFYFADQVIPMLPERLSNGICSLNEGEERLTLSCRMEINAQGDVVKSELFESVIRSKRRLVYEDVTKALGGDSAMRETLSDVMESLSLMEELMHVLNAKRMRMGSVDFDLPEAALTFDEKGNVTDVFCAERGEANRIIEECMLVCNQTVAKFLREGDMPTLFRVHEAPDPDRLAGLNAFLSTLGYGVSNAGHIEARDVQKLILAARGTNEEALVNRLALRSMQKARYAERPLGHFALAMRDYCHFTSPIRRYPDLVTHRAVKALLLQKQSPETRESLAALAVSTSAAERLAVEAERAVEAKKKCEYMRAHVGETFEGAISGVAQNGLYFELPNTIEGFIRFGAFTDDVYDAEVEAYRAVGRRTGRVLRLGDRFTAELTCVDTATDTLDFSPVSGYHTDRIYNPSKAPKRRGKHAEKAQKPERTRKTARKGNKRNARQKRG